VSAEENKVVVMRMVEEVQGMSPGEGTELRPRKVLFSWIIVLIQAVCATVFWLVTAAFAAFPFASGCHRLCPLGSTNASSFARRC
jgi:hypothetical protein